MKHITSFILTAALTSMAVLPLQAEETIELFDGKTLNGWTGNPAFWSVEDGAIVGSTMTTNTKKNTFLIAEKLKVRDFTLTFEAKLEGGNNSGVQYRSEVKDAETWSVKGYQCDMHPKPAFVGMLYGEGLGRGIIAKRGQKVKINPENGKAEEVEEYKDPEPIDLTQWQKYTITAKGNHLIHKVNDEVTLDLKDEHKNALVKGIIALQVHAGKPMKVSFRDFKLTHH